MLALALSLGVFLVGSLRQDTGRTALSREACTSLLDRAEALGDRALRARALLGLWSLARRAGDEDEAAALRQDAAELVLALAPSELEAVLADESLPGIEELWAVVEAANAERVVLLLLQAARIFEDRRESVRERAVCESALGLCESLPPDIGATLELRARGQLINALLDLGEWESAAYRIDDLRGRATLLGQRIYEKQLLSSEAELAYRLGDVPRAIRASTRLEELSREQESLDSWLQAQIFLGLLFEEEGRIEDARELYQTALSRGGSAGRGALRTALLINLARAQRLLGHAGAAERSLTLVREIGLEVPDPLMDAAAGVGLAHLRAAEGGHEQALELARAAAASFAELGRSDFVPNALEVVAEVARARGDAETLRGVVDQVERLLDRGDLEALEPRDLAGYRSRFTFWADAAQDLALLRVGSSPPGSPERSEAVSDGFRWAGCWKGRALLSGLRARLSGRDSQLGQPGRLDAPSVQEALGPLSADGVIVVEYVAGARELCAYVQDATGLRLESLGDRREIESLAKSYVELVQSSAPPASAVELVSIGSLLASRLLAPLVQLPEAGGEPLSLIVIPTLELSTLPFEALVIGVRDPEQGLLRLRHLDFLVDRAAVAYAPSAPVLAALARLPERGLRGPALLIADPELTRRTSDDPSGNELFQGRDLEPLTWTRPEAIGIAEHLLEAAGEEGRRHVTELFDAKRASDVALVTPFFHLYLGGAARAGRLREANGPFSLVHCATHGLVDLADPRRTGLVFGNDLAEDSFLSLQDVLDLRLQADLVVLSACGTARGRPLRGEGIQSLAAGFLEAGARSVVASLWKVEDLGTEMLMRQFYSELLASGRSEPEALRRAKQGLRSRTERGEPMPRPDTSGDRECEHPHAWAAFLFIGSGI